MTVMEALLEGLKVTVVGLAIVFSVLIILMLILMLMKVVFAKEPKKTTEVIEAKPAETTPAPATAQSQAEDDIDEEELIAVLTAAIAASLNTSTYNLQIKSYRRIENNAPAWNRAGIRDTIDSRF